MRSPLNYVANVTTPTMLMTGEADLRTPIGANRGVLSRVEDAKEGNAHGPHARGVSRVAASFAAAGAATLSQAWFEKHRRPSTTTSQNQR